MKIVKMMNRRRLIGIGKILCEPYDNSSAVLCIIFVHDVSRLKMERSRAREVTREMSRLSVPNRSQNDPIIKYVYAVSH